MASRYYGKFDVSLSWIRALGMLDADIPDGWLVVGIDRDLQERISQRWPRDVSHWVHDINVYANAPTCDIALYELRKYIISNYIVGIPFDYEIWHVVESVL